MKDLELILKGLCEITGTSKVSFIESAIKEKLNLYLNEENEFCPREAIDNTGATIYVLYDTCKMIGNEQHFAYGCIKKGSTDVFIIPEKDVTFKKDVGETTLTSLSPNLSFRTPFPLIYSTRNNIYSAKVYFGDDFLLSAAVTNCNSPDTLLDVIKENIVSNYNGIMSADEKMLTGREKRLKKWMKENMVERKVDNS